MWEDSSMLSHHNRNSGRYRLYRSNIATCQLYIFWLGLQITKYTWCTISSFQSPFMTVDSWFSLTTDKEVTASSPTQDIETAVYWQMTCDLENCWENSCFSEFWKEQESTACSLLSLFFCCFSDPDLCCWDISTQNDLSATDCKTSFNQVPMYKTGFSVFGKSLMIHES